MSTLYPDAEAGIKIARTFLNKEKRAKYILQKIRRGYWYPVTVFIFLEDSSKNFNTHKVVIRYDRIRLQGTEYHQARVVGYYLFMQDNNFRETDA